MLKRIIITCLTALICFCIHAQKDSDVLMKVGNNKVTVDEFRYIYEKNNGENADYSKESLDEYIDLYTKFKLKVEKAKSMKLDTIKSLQQELQGYRSQLANSFLTDKEVFNKLMEEIHERQKEDVRISHILVQVKPNGPNQKKEEAKKKLLNIKQQLREGKSFAALAKEYSDDKNSKDKGGDLGFITAYLPTGFYELENAMYTLNPNEVSEPIQTKLGFHLVKVIEKRPARGKIEVAHIFRKIDKTNRTSVTESKRIIDSIYLALQGGNDFAQLAKTYSEDKTTKDKGGVLPAFGIAVYDSKFEDAAFALTEEGQVSRPIRTSVGYHIIKKIGNPAPKTVAELKLMLKERIKKFDRYGIAQDKMITRIKESSQFRERKNVMKTFISTLDKDFYSYKWRPQTDMKDDVLLSFGPNSDELLSDFAAFARKQTRLRSQFDKSKPIEEAVDEIYQEFIKTKAYEFEQANLESKYPEFKSLMREYSEGILLFEATKINVWDKANKDTLGLYNFYEENKSKYIFEEQATIGKYIVNSTDKKQLKKIMKCAKKHDVEKTLKRFNKNGKEMIEYSEIKVEPGNKELVGLEFKKKSISEPIIDNNSKKSLFKKVVEVTPSRRKSLKEARGYVVADYQDQLEQRWISELKREYTVEIDEEIYNQLIKK
ncbi:MAG: peptidylprolyl isomerase [Saprospiraceae bacterium]|nr:peptidylprolyl isomerase [Saprospiraceae bacterium]